MNATAMKQSRKVIVDTLARKYGVLTRRSCPTEVLDRALFAANDSMPSSDDIDQYGTQPALRRAGALAANQVLIGSRPGNR